MSVTWKLFISLSCGLVALTGLSQSQTVYHLNPDSSFQQGCFPPCLCPVMVGAPVKGTFLLTPTGFDGLFNTYAVTDVNWSVLSNSTATVVTGSGTYKIGGEFALQQELSLDLQFNGGNQEHFDSGLVTGPAPFPDIKVTISTNRQYCFDSVFNVSASPIPMPQLHLGFTGTGTLTVSWPVSSTPFVLQESSELTPTSWTNVTNAPTVVGQQNQVALSRSSGNKFYRLQPAAN